MMKQTRYIISLTLLAIPLALEPTVAFTQKAQLTAPSYTLQCHGVTSTSTSLKQDGPKAITGKGTDELRIARYGQTLRVQANPAMYNSMDRKSKAILQKPDLYKITGETGEGFVALSVIASTSLHTLTIDRSLKYAIWTESGFSFLEPQSEPINYTVFLTCTQENQ